MQSPQTSISAPGGAESPAVSSFSSYGLCAFCGLPFVRKRLSHKFCRPLCKNRNRPNEKLAAYARRYRARFPEKEKEFKQRYHRRKRQWRLFMEKYGLTKEVYQQMLAEQESKCRICRRNDKKLVVDHDHKTKNIRGLICRSCNFVLGYAQDDPKILIAAAEYLQRPVNL